MGDERAHRQFILIFFEDLDHPEFVAFLRSPAFGTYAVMRRHIWRSDEQHYMGLHELHRQGYLTCSLEREKIAEAVGGVSERTISRDIAHLTEQRIIESTFTGRQNIYILGEWGMRADVRYEVFYLSRMTGQPGHKCQGTRDKPDAPALTDMASNNIEGNREPHTETSSRATRGTKLTRPVLQLLKDTGRELRDTDPGGSIGTLQNIWKASPTPASALMETMQEARQVTKQRISSGVIRNGEPGRREAMAYFFRVLEDRLKGE